MTHVADRVPVEGYHRAGHPNLVDWLAVGDIVDHDCVGPRDHTWDFLRCRNTHTTPSYAASHTPVSSLRDTTHTMLYPLYVFSFLTINVLARPLVL